MNVGFIGLGTMGAPMARNVMKKGHRLVVHDTQGAAVQSLVDAGAHAATTPAGSRGVVRRRHHHAAGCARRRARRSRCGRHRRGIRSGSVYIDMSTIDPATTRKVGAAIAAKSASMIDSPVGKTADAAVSGTLTLMVGGPADVVARVRPVLDCMGTDFFHCGELGAGQTIKLINNLLATCIAEATFEALVTEERPACRSKPWSQCSRRRWRGAASLRSRCPSDRWPGTSARAS
jgi:3-hydroxyisobutyrate dehydrogenase-like beta-hydroxyacid dehydrogenase